MYKVDKLYYDHDGYCDINRNDLIMCGYCERCNYTAECYEGGASLWKKKNWEYTMIARIKIKKAREKALRDLYISTGNENSLKHTWCTIGLPKDYSLQKMIICVEKIQAKDLYGLGDSVASYEWYSETSPDGGNLHIHLLAVNNTKKYKPGTIATKLAKFFGIKANFVDVINGNSDFLNRVNYVCGIKDSKEKNIYAEKDKEWRKLKELPHVTCGLPENLRTRFADKLQLS